MTTTAKILSVPAVFILLAGGFWLVAANVGEGTTAFWAGVAWWAVVSAALLLVVRARRGLRVPVIATLALTTLAALVVFWTITRDTEVSEQIAVGAPAADAEPDAGASGGQRKEPEEPMNVEVASGRFEGTSGHSGTGKAAVVELAEGDSVLTFSEFDVDPGAGLDSLRVYLTEGNPSSDGEVTDFEEIAKLKGTKGNQQYELPKDIDGKKFESVVIWCVPFSTRIAQAELS